jgi:hypothetical protein
MLSGSRRRFQYDRSTTNQIIKKLITALSHFDNDGATSLGSRKRVLGAVLSTGVLVQHNLDLATNDTSSQYDVTDGGINAITGGLTHSL